MDCKMEIGAFIVGAGHGGAQAETMLRKLKCQDTSRPLL